MVLFQEKDYKIYEILLFDDGIEHYLSYLNKWYVIGSWRGKSRLQNIENKNITINSISTWKIKDISC